MSMSITLTSCRSLSVPCRQLSTHTDTQKAGGGQTHRGRYIDYFDWDNINVSRHGLLKVIGFPELITEHVNRLQPA